MEVDIVTAPADVVSLTRQLISIPSESSNQTRTDPAAPEKDMVALLNTLCREHGLVTEEQEALPGRNNVIIRFPRPGLPHLLITAHMDTVSAHGMDNPFDGIVADGQIHGRGACDDKGPMAAALAALLMLHNQKKPLDYDITFAASVDEECTMAGATRLAELVPNWDLCLALEPTNLRVIKAHKGVYRFLVKTSGRAAHSSTPDQGVNALHAMLPIIADLQRYDEELRRTLDPEMGGSFLSFTQLQAGSSLNIIPDACSLGVDVRTLPEIDPRQVVNDVQQIVGDRGVIEEAYLGGGIRTDMSLPLIRAFQACNVACGGGIDAITAPFATDCSKLTGKGPCIVWGPGDIAQAHKQEEYIDIDQLETACRVLQRFLAGNA